MSHGETSDVETTQADQTTATAQQPTLEDQPANVSTIKNFINIIASPLEAFRDLKVRSPILPPMLLVLITQALTLVVYFQLVDFDWLVDAMVERQLAEAPEEVREATRSFYAAAGPNGMMGLSMLSIVLMFPLITLLYCGYLTIVSSVANLGIRFGKWFALIWWTSLPMVFSATASIFSILLTSDGQISQEEINPLTLNNLIFSLQPTDDYFAMAANVDIPIVWATVLSIVGFKVWSGKDYFTSAAIILAPWIAIIGIVVLVN